MMRRGARWGRHALVLVGALLALVLGGWAVAEAATVLTPGLALTGVDADVTGYLLEERETWLTRLMRAVTLLGDLRVVAGLVIVLGLAAWRRTRRWRGLWIPALAGGGAFVISVAVKLATGRGRPPPELAVVDAAGSAFPSGHSIRAMAVYAALAWLAARVVGERSRQVTVWVGAAVIIGGVGFSRIYLGAHWLTDVLAGYVLGAAWLGVVLWSAYRGPATFRGQDAGVAS